MDPISALLAEELETVRGQQSGQTAQYIPSLAQADPDQLGMAVVGPRGSVISVGDDTTAFTIQSMSKPFVFALALAAHGRARMLAQVGVEPSGEPFNAISLEPNTGRPANPLVNAGAIATTGMIPGDSSATRDALILDGLSRFAGRDLVVDEKVYESESETGDRNRALAFLLRSHGVIGPDPQAVVESYFRQCSIVVTVQDVAVMAATLAFGGRNPVTGEQVVSSDIARDVVSVMTSCGMYDFSGEWMLRVGMPAKSGVSGGILAVSPSQFGVGVFSPRLDQHGNSVRGILLLEKLSDDYGMHQFDHHESIAHPGISLSRDSNGPRVHLGGELALSGMERIMHVLREFLDEIAPDESVTLDARELAQRHPAAVLVLRAEVERLGERVALLE